MRIMENNKKNIIILTIIVVIISSLVITLIKEKKKDMKKEEKSAILTGDFNVDLVKKVHEFDKDENYLISPYNISLALNMLRDGADGKTKEELDKVLGNRSINDLQIKDKIGIANAVFIRDIYKDNVKEEYYNILKTKYNSDIIYDEFIKPDKINSWVKEKTNNMIDKILDQMNKDYVMGLASALAIDVKWENAFECINTKGNEFTKKNNDKINVQMMHKTFDTDNYKYIDTTDAEGIIIPYEKIDNSSVELEFVGILPKKDIDTFINELTKEKLDVLLKTTKSASDKLHINLSLPRFSYDYEVSKFIDVLKHLGIKEAFDSDNANFKKMIEIKENVYVGEAIHKTHIELNEVGTKAAAVTYFGMFKNSAMIEKDYEEIDINFNKPFIYLIREKNTNEILFFGEVVEPNVWNGSTCDNKK